MSTVKELTEQDGMQQTINNKAKKINGIRNNIPIPEPIY